MNGKLLNSIIAAGVLVGHGLIFNKIINHKSKTDSNKAAAVIHKFELQNDKNISKNDKNIIKLSKEESTVATYLYSIIMNTCKNESDDVKISEVTKIVKTMASYGAFTHKTAFEQVKNSDFDGINTKDIIFDLNSVSEFFKKCIYFAKDLVNNPSILEWNSQNYENVPLLVTLKNTPLNDSKFAAAYETDYFIFYKFANADSLNNDNLEIYSNTNVSDDITEKDKINTNSNKKIDNAIKSDIQIDISKMSNDETFLARILYSETSSTCTEDELKLICNVILNRVGHKDFGNAKNAAEVARIPSAFSATKKSNIPFKEFLKRPNDPYVIRAKKYAKAIMTNKTDLLNLGKNDTIVYYHDKSITIPNDWINRYYVPVEVMKTTHFIFYKIKVNTENLTPEEYKERLQKQGKLYTPPKNNKNIV